MPAVFPPQCGQALRNVSVIVTDSDNTDTFLNQMIQFYSNNATNLYRLTSHSTTYCPTT